MSAGVYYIGLDVHKKLVVYCTMLADGTIVARGKFGTTTEAVTRWAQSLERPWQGVLEATMFSHRLHDLLRPFATQLHMANPSKLKAITASRKKSDRSDAETLANLLRADLVPAVWVMPPDLRQLRELMRYRTSIIQSATRMKNKISGTLMSHGVEYDSKRLHGKRYFTQLLQELTELPESVVWMLKNTRQSMETFSATQKQILRELEKCPALEERVERLKSIDGVGTVTSLVWALEVGDPRRFSSTAKAQSYCGLCSALNESAGKQKRGPISRQRNKHLQTVLVEASKLAPSRSPQLRQVHEKELQRGDRNRATLAVARKLVAYLMAVDRGGKAFVAPSEAA